MGMEDRVQQSSAQSAVQVPQTREHTQQSGKLEEVSRVISPPGASIHVRIVPMSDGAIANIKSALAGGYVTYTR